MRIPNYIAKTQPCRHRRRTVTKSAGSFFETIDMANHLPSRLYFGFWMNNDLCFKKLTGSRKLINGGSKERALRGAEFQRGTQILKINRISLAYDLTSNQDQTFFNKSCFVFLLYRGMCWVCAIFGRFGGMVRSRLASLDSPLKVMAPRSWLICISVYLQNLKTISAQIVSKKCIQIIPYIVKLYHRFKQNVPESDSRQSDRLRLRLWLLARCHDSRRLRLRLRTPDRDYEGRGTERRKMVRGC